MAIRLLRIDTPPETTESWTDTWTDAETAAYQPVETTDRESIGRRLRRRLGFTLLESPFRPPGHAWLDDIEVTDKLRELAARPPMGRRGRRLVLLEADR